MDYAGYIGQVWATVKFAAFNAVNSSQHVGISLMLFLHSVTELLSLSLYSYLCMPYIVFLLLMFNCELLMFNCELWTL